MNTMHSVTRAGAAARTGRLTTTVLVVLVLLVPLTAATASPATGPSTAATAATATVQVHFTRSGGACDATTPFPREVATPRVLAGALEQLLAGPSAAERAAGARSFFGPDTAGMLRSVRITGGVAHVDFADLRDVIPGASSSCGSAALLAQLDATVMQFPTVQRARYAIEGSEATVSEWLQRGAPGGVVATRGTLANRGAIRHLDGDQATLRTVRVGRHHGFDRVVFEFAGGVPGYAVRYVPVARTDGAGAPIATRGTVALQVHLAADSVDREADGFPLTFTPEAPISVAYPTLRHVRFGGFFEGGTTFGVGLTGRSGFRVLELTGPSRLAIDVAHGAVPRDLRAGQRGADVRDWQRRLNLVQFGGFAVTPGHAQGRLTADGTFGPATRRATRTFQRAEGVDVSGVVDAATRAAMYRALVRAGRIGV